MAHQCGFTLSPASRKNSTRIGRAATRVERIQLCNGSYAWVHAMSHLGGVVRRLLHRESDRVDDEWLQGNVDRKSTRLNSSHGYISYAVFCLKKKKRNKLHTY